MNRIQLRILLNISIGVTFLIASIAIIFLLNRVQRHEALHEAEAKARILLDRNLATHIYFSEILKPRVMDWSATFRPSNTFEPSWMSSSYAVRHIGNFFEDLNRAGYYIKDAAINARSPENEADPYEAAFIEELKRKPGLERRFEVRSIDGQPYFVVLRRGGRMDASCLQCHDTPERAPAELVRAYGPSRSFGRKPGEQVSAISMRIPLAAAYADADRFSAHLSALLLCMIGGIFVVQLSLHQRFLFRPLERLRRQVVAISEGAQHLGEPIPVPAGRELGDLTNSFNTMSASLLKERQLLEERVRQRTAELAEANRLLQADIAERKKVESEREQLIKELRQALANVKTLSGLLPICAGCKKVRDDKGYWNQIETYIASRSEAQFTHGLCPECIRMHYPDLGPL